MMDSAAVISPPPRRIPYDHLFKVLVIGDSGVGKSCLLLRYVDNTFTDQFISTIGVDFKLKTTQVDDKVIKLQIWDTAGQERFKSITATYYRGANGILICFDLTDPDSFTAIQHWLDDTKRLASSNVPIVLIGNKADLKKQRMVSYAQAKEYADKVGIPYFETSAKTGYNLDKVFETLTNMMLYRRVAGKDMDTSSLSSKLATRRKCCS